MKELKKIKDAFQDILFVDKNHTYIHKPTGNVLDSTTQRISKFKPPFRLEEISKAVAKREGKTQKEIKRKWDLSGKLGRIRGNLIHNYLEFRVYNKEFEDQNNYHLKHLKSQKVIDKYEAMIEKLKLQADNWVEDNSHLLPIRSELVVGDIDYNLGGMIDLLSYDLDNKEFVLIDYKTNNKLDRYCDSRNYNKPLEHLDDSKFTKFSLQLSIYQEIINKHTGLDINNKYVIWFNRHNDNYKVIPLKDLNEEAKTILEWIQ